MATFRYKGYSKIGELQAGLVEAADREAVLNQLRSQDIFCFEVIQEREKEVQSRPLKLKELTSFCRQLSSMLTAGINMSRALDTMYRSNANKRIRDTALTLYESVLKGQPLSESMRQLGKTFPELLISMVETGEMSGTLEEILETMAAHYEQELQMKKKAQSALIYPAILSIVSIIVVVFMLTFVLPTFVKMYDGVDLPVPTQIIMRLSDFVRTQWGLLLGVLLGLALLIPSLMSLKKVRIRVKKTLLYLPVVGRLLRTILTARFASTFAVLYSSGIGILQSTDILSRVVNNDYVEQRLLEVKDRLQEGQLLSAALEQMNVFDRVLVTMVAVGEESGTMDSMLQKSGKNFQKEAEMALTQMVALIEPLMIVLLGVVVGFIVLAMILPVFSMYQQIM